MENADKRRARRRRWYLAHRAEEAIKRKQRYAKRRERELATNAKWRAAHPNYMRQLRGLPEATRPCPAQCECCGKRKATHLDHDHKTDAFRGWLCGNCNRGIGQLGDDVQGIQNAMGYLTSIDGRRSYG
jgi:hypothetical protein